MTRTQRPSQQEVAKLGESSRAIGEFLDWAEQEMELVLCEAYQPKYAWYRPTTNSREKLLTEFLARESMAGEPARQSPALPDNGTAPSSGHGRPSRRAMLRKSK